MIYSKNLRTVFYKVMISRLKFQKLEGVLACTYYCSCCVFSRTEMIGMKWNFMPEQHLIWN